MIAASSAAFNIEIFAYYVLNSFSQACTTFTGQNYGAGNLKRCRKVLLLCIVEDVIATASAIILVLLSGKVLLSIFSSDPQVIEIGYTRLVMVFSAYTFSMLYENLSGYHDGIPCQPVRDRTADIHIRHGIQTVAQTGSFIVNRTALLHPADIPVSHDPALQYNILIHK